MRRCPRLGGTVPFRYCLTAENGELICHKVVDCWWQYFDVLGYLRKQMTAEELTALLAKRPRPKVTSIMELIEQARRNNDIDSCE
ncbi:MAG: hypothetical protein PVJ53_00835 [Desulfobacterales bacterium]|jgi:hypothetical protein